MTSNRVKSQLSHNFQDIISLENLFVAWREFVRGKRKRRDVQEFSLRLADNIIVLHSDLNNLTYKHGGYQAFNISDPKPRNIHKASVRDRLLHHAIYRKLYPFFDKVFIADSYSCRLDKGTHKAINKFREFTCKVSKNNTRTCWILKCDIRKFFANIDHEILLSILKEYIPDRNVIWLLEKVIKSFTSINNSVGLPLGNLTSQLFVNIYMNKFDRSAKHKLKVKYYIRYADDFVIFSEDRKWLAGQILIIRNFLHNELKLELHPEKIYIKTLSSGLDFLGWVNFPDYRVLRTATKRRMMKRIKESPTPERISFYLGLLKHENAEKLWKEITAERN